MPFKKGENGNPGGRKRAKERQLREVLLKYLPEAERAVKRALQDPDTQLAAAKEIFDRVYGKSREMVQVDGNISINIKLIKAATDVIASRAALIDKETDTIDGGN